MRLTLIINISKGVNIEDVKNRVGQEIRMPSST